MQFNTNQIKNIENLRKSQKCVENTYIFMKLNLKTCKNTQSAKKRARNIENVQKTHYEQHLC